MVKQAGNMATEMDAWIKVNNGTPKMKTGSHRAKRYTDFAAAAHSVVDIHKKKPTDTAAIMEAAATLQLYGEPPEEVVKALEKKLNKGESLSFAHVEDPDEEEDEGDIEDEPDATGPPVAQEATAEATKIVTEAFDKTGSFNKFRKPIEDYMKAQKMDPATMSDAARSKFIRLVSQEISIPRKGDPDMKWKIFPEWEKKIAAWIANGLVKDLLSLLDAPDADTDLQSLLKIGSFGKKGCVEHAISVFKAVHDKFIEGNEEAASAAFTKYVTKAWRKLDTAECNKAHGALCNLMSHAQITDDMKKGTVVFLTTKAGELPSDLRARDGLDGGQTALCKAIAKADTATVAKILAADGTKEQLSLGGHDPNCAIQWAQGEKVMEMMMAPVLPFVMCLNMTPAHKKASLEIAKMLMDIHCPAPTDVANAQDTTMLMMAIANTDIALKLIAIDSSNECIAKMDQTKATVLHKLAFVSTDTVVAEALIKANREGVMAVLKQPDFGQTTALMMAAYYGNENYAKLLVGLDASKEHLEMGAFGGTPLSSAQGALKDFLQAAWDKVKDN